MTPLLTRIASQMAATTDPVRQAALQAERGCYLARTGRLAEAGRIAADLRRAYGDGRSATVSVWVMLLEGLVLYFGKVSFLTRDRVLRAQRVSTSMRLPYLAALTSAWLAHMEFERSAYDGVASMAADALLLDAAAVGAADVRCRVATVLGGALLHAGQADAAQLWYEHGRSHALAAGDQATLGALMYNRVALRLARLRLSSHGDGAAVLPAELASIGMELESAWNYQVLTQTRALPHLFDICRARILVLQQQWAAAVPLLRRLCANIDDREDRGNRPLLTVDLAWCLLQQDGQADLEASALIDGFDAGHCDQLDADDRVVCLSTLAKACTLLGRTDAAAAHAAGAARARHAHAADMQALAAALASIGPQMQAALATADGR